MLFMRYFIYFAMIFLLFLTAGCSDGDSQSAKNGKSNLLVDVIKGEKYSPEEFMKVVSPKEQFKELHELFPDLHPMIETTMRIKMLSRLVTLDALFQLEVGCNSKHQRQWQMESYVFTYMSKSADGADVLLSGRVTFPNNMVEGVGHEVETLSIFSHPKIPGVSWVPSNNLDIMMLRAFFNSAVIEPDFQGYGVDEGKHKNSAYVPKVTMLQLADCVTAALEVMRQHDVKLAPEGFSENWGGSHTSATTVYFQKYYETEAPAWFRKAVRLRSSFVTTNIRDYNVAEIQDITGPEPRSSEAFRDVITSLTTQSPAQMRGYKISDFLSYRAMTEKVGDGDNKMTAYQYMTRLIAYPNVTNLAGPIADWTLVDLAAPEMLTANGLYNMSNPKAADMVDIFHNMNDYGDFKPTLPIYLCQHKEDEYFTQDDFMTYCTKLSENGTNPNVHYANIPLKTTNSLVYDTIGLQYNHFLSYVLSMLYAVTSPTAAEAFENVIK